MLTDSARLTAVARVDDVRRVRRFRRFCRSCKFRRFLSLAVPLVRLQSPGLALGDAHRFRQVDSCGPRERRLPRSQVSQVSQVRSVHLGSLTVRWAGLVCSVRRFRCFPEARPLRQFAGARETQIGDVLGASSGSDVLHRSANHRKFSRLDVGRKDLVKLTILVEANAICNCNRDGRTRAVNEFSSIGRTHCRLTCWHD